MHPATPDAPQWAQLILVAAGALAVFAGTILQYIKKGKQTAGSTDVAVVSATFADRRTIEALADALDRHERTIHELCEESRRTRHSVEANTDAQINMLRFMKGRTE